MAESNVPRGVQRTKDGVEYQLFPESYFAGADVKIYFGDTFVDDIMGISFILQEQVRPLSSYASRTFKQVARGNRLVQGKFYIAFREAGWLSTMLDHIAPPQTGKNTENDLVQVMKGDPRQKFIAKALQTMERVLGEYNEDPNSNPYQTRFAAYEREVWGRNLSMDPNHEGNTFFYRSRTNPTWQKSLKERGFDIFLIYGPLEQATLADRDIKYVPFETTVKAIRGVQITAVSQEVMPDNTIVEAHDFIAKDLD